MALCLCTSQPLISGHLTNKDTFCPKGVQFRETPCTASSYAACKVTCCLLHHVQQQSLKSEPAMKLERPKERNSLNYTQSLHQSASNGTVGGSTHLQPPANPFANRRRKYHYITIATGNPSHYRTSPSPSRVPAPGAHQVTTATVSPTPPLYPPAPNATHQRMVLQPPALVRNKYLGTATLL